MRNRFRTSHILESPLHRCLGGPLPLLKLHLVHQGCIDLFSTLSKEDGCDTYGNSPLESLIKISLKEAIAQTDTHEPDST